MPIKSFQIRTAVGHRSVEIRSMVLLPIKLNSIIIETGCLAVPGLVNHIILGFDWMQQKEVTIKIKREEKGLELK